MKSTIKMFGLAAAMLLPLLTQAQNVDLRCSFENSGDAAAWTIVNSSTVNKWYIDTAVAASGNYSMYISSNNGVSNTYNTDGSSSVSYAYQTFWFDSGDYYISYNWQCNGERNYDFLRVFLAPGSATFAPDTLPGGVSSYNFTTVVPTGWICLSGSSPLNQVTSWENFSTTFSVTQADTFHLVFVWCSDAGAGDQPAAAVDDIRMSEIICPNTAIPTISGVSDTSFCLSWVDTSGAYQWYIELDSAGQAQGTGYIITTGDSSYTFTDLTPNSTYHVYIATDCNGDTSYWHHFAVKTACVGLRTLPYTENFETCPNGGVNSANFVDCWERINNYSSYAYGYPYVSYSTSHNGGSRALYWYSYGDSGPYKGVVLPLVDTSTHPLNTLQVSFWAKATSASYRPVFVVGIMPNILDINTFVPVRTVTITSGTDWEQVTVDFSDYHGPFGRIAVLAPLPVSTWYAYTDEFTIDVIPACSTVGNIAVNRIGSGSAYLSWSLQGGSTGTVTGYEIQYDTVGATNYRFVDTVAGSPYILSGLDHATDYQLRIRALCSLDTTTGAWDSILFSSGHMPCLQPSNNVDTVVYSTGTSTSSGIFVYSGWGNTFCEAIYTATDLQNAGVRPGRITGLTLGYNTAGSYDKEISIFMGHTTMNYFGSASNMVDVGTLTEVCHAVSRPHTAAYAGWVNYNFTTPFYWDGHSNVIIAFFVNQPSGVSHSSSGFYAYSTPTSPTRSGASAYRYKDGSQFTLSTQQSFSGSGTSTYLPSISFHVSECLQYDSCSAPLLLLSRCDLDSVIIDWGAGHNETSWTIYYMADDDTGWTVVPNVTDRQYVFTGFLPQTHYTVRVASDCGDGSAYSSVNFTMPCLPITTLPFTEDFENFTASSASGSPTTPCWNRLTTYSYSYYPYTTTSYAHSGVRSLYFYGGGSYSTALVLPNMGIPADTLQVTFAAYKTSANYNIMVGVMTDPDDFGTFVPVSTVSPANVNEWEMFDVPLNTYTGNGRYIAIASAGSSTSYFYLDDVTVDYMPSCPRPNNITFRNVLTNTAEASWDSTGTGYILEYGPYGFNHGEGLTLFSFDDSTILYGLAHSTRYQLYIRAICGPGDTSDWSFPVAFTTQCSDIDTLPFREEFLGWGVGTGARPACWTMGGYSNYPYVANLVTDDSTYRVLYMYTYGSSQVYASLPPLDSVRIPIHTAQLVFTAMGNNSTSYSRTVVVGVCSRPGDITTFSPVDTIRLTNIPNTYEVSFDTVTSGAKYITLISLTERGLYGNYAYIIDAQVESIPHCQTPNRVSAVNITATSADIQWNSRSGATLWEIEYGPRGFALGTGTRANVVANPYTITGLTPSSVYDVYLRSICATGDTSSWTRSPMRFSTLQMPAPVPYFYNFEDGAEWSNWQTNSNSTANWYRDTAAGNGNPSAAGRYSIYISTDSGATISTYTNAIVNAVAYRDFDFGNDPYHSYELSFRASAGGAPANAQGNVYDGLTLLHVNPNAPVEASTDGLYSPWGRIDTLSRYFLVHGISNWNTYSTILDTLTGVHRFALYWFNQNISGFIGNPASVDDFTIVSHDCPRPSGIRASNVSITSADISWVGPDTATFRVMLFNQGGPTYTLDTIVHTNSIHVTGLNSANSYRGTIRRVCGDELSIVSPNFSFMTLICNGSTSTTLETANATTSPALPLVTTTRYSYTQQLVLASELTGSGEISALNLRYTGSAAMNDRTNCTIYMGHTSMSSFSGNFVIPDSLTVVYTGAIRPSEGWTRLIFQTPFMYNGTDNIVIAVDDNSNSSHTDATNQNFAVDQIGSSMAIAFSGSTDVIPTRAYLLEHLSDMQTFSSRNQMLIEVCPPNPCPTPSLRTPLVRTGSVTLRWQPTAERYAVSYRLANTTSWTADLIMVDTNRYTINRVQPNTDYVYRVRQYCDTTGVSNWAYGTFNSSDIPCLPPENLQATSVYNNRVVLRWSPAENNITYHLHVFNYAFDVTDTCYISRSTVRGLQAGVTYFAAVRAECDGFTEPGEFSDTISFTTPTCPDASNLQVTEIYGNSVVLDWTPGGSETAWEILYGHYGFREEEGFRVTANEHPFTLGELFGSTEYQAYVRTLCASDFPGEHWIGPVEFTTLYSSINGIADDARVHLMPNPTHGDVTVTLPEGKSDVKVEVVDITGRTCMTAQFEGSSYRLSTSRLAAGTYFLRITANDINTVKKLVVK